MYNRIYHVEPIAVTQHILQTCLVWIRFSSATYVNERLPDSGEPFFLFDPHIVLIFFPISLALETSEIQERFQCQDAVKDKEELAAELADVALYLLQLASVTEIDLEKAILDKIEINKTREWNQE